MTRCTILNRMRELEQHPPADATLAEVGTALLDALDLLEGCDIVIAIDAVQANHAPGTVCCFDGRDILNLKPLSLHEFGLSSALQYLPAEARPQVLVLGVEPAVIAYGMELSSIVERTIPEVVRLVHVMVRHVSQPGQTTCLSEIFHHNPEYFHYTR